MSGSEIEQVLLRQEIDLAVLRVILRELILTLLPDESEDESEEFLERFRALVMRDAPQALKAGSRPHLDAELRERLASRADKFLSELESRFGNLRDMVAAQVQLGAAGRRRHN